jgi:hypothetical protein
MSINSPAAKRWRRRVGAPIAVVMAVITGLLIVNVGFASTATSFAIDGRVKSTGSLEDWDKGTGSGAGVLAGRTCAAGGTNPILICDDVKTDATTFPGGAKESDPSGWLPIQASQVTPKTDITNVYAYGFLDGSSPILINAMERLPKAGDLHLDFEYNKVMTEAGIPARRVNDLLIAYDMAGNRDTNGGGIKVSVYKAVKKDNNCNGADCEAVYNYAKADISLTFDGNGTDVKNGVKAAMNLESIPAGSWGSYDAGGKPAETILPFGFAEVQVDLASTAGLSSVCANWVTVKSRSSESVTSQLKDTTGPKQFGFCGGLSVTKFIDVNGNGVVNTTGTPADITSGPHVSGWQFTVKGPHAQAATDAQVDAATTACAGTTDTTGALSCSSGSPGDLSQLQPGWYTVIETDGTNHYVTTPTGAPSLRRLVQVSTSSASVTFGNMCLSTMKFQVTGVPANTSNVAAWYNLGGGATDVDVALAATTTGGSIYEGTTGAIFKPTDSITWGYKLGGTKNTNINRSFSFSGTAYPGCARDDTVSFQFGTISGTKWEDINGDANQDNGDLGLGGFVFELKSGSTVIASTTSAPNGNFSFANVAPGSYTVHERVNSEGAATVGGASGSTSPSGWLLTTSNDQSVTVNASGAASGSVSFGNTPLSNVQVIFTPQTTHTQGAISCVTNGGGTGSQPVGCSTGTSTVTHTANGLQTKQSTIVCTVTITHKPH